MFLSIRVILSLKCVNFVFVLTACCRWKEANETENEPKQSRFCQEKRNNQHLKMKKEA